jgi:hypothetical protein
MPGYNGPVPAMLTCSPFSTLLAGDSPAKHPAAFHQPAALCEEWSRGIARSSHLRYFSLSIILMLQNNFVNTFWKIVRIRANDLPFYQVELLKLTNLSK